MLQQILNDMWVDPEILAELDESQKQTLFCKMREEQVRRWKIWDEANPPKPKTTSKKKVDFRLDEKGEPWTWVMGEHPDDKTIEEILEEEARDAARRLAEAERLAELLEQNKRQREEIEVAQQKLDAEEIYCSADELRIDVKPVLPVVSRIPAVQSTNLRRDALQEISFNKLPKVSQQVALWEKRVVEERTSEIYKKIQKMKLEAVKEAEEAENKHEHFWREQQKKAKEEEQRRREIARIAREEHRRSMQDIEPEKPAIPPRKDTANPSKPPNKDAIVEWFKSSQVNRKAGLDPNTNSVASWFHGLITRQEAENLLSLQPVGSFLVRVSERIWGYAISYKDTDRCKHYLIDASNDHYQFLGTNQISHKTLGDLVTYHANRPITEAGGELLGRACHRTKPLPLVFQGLSIRAR